MTERTEPGCSLSELFLLNSVSSFCWASGKGSVFLRCCIKPLPLSKSSLGCAEDVEGRTIAFLANGYVEATVANCLDDAGVAA